MQRKLVKQGRNALTLTLPSGWAKNHSLSAGDSVELVEKKDSIIISPPKKNSNSSFEIRISSANQWYVKQVMRYCYFSNFSEIRIYFDDSKIGSIIRDYAPSLLGLEIVDHSKGCCTLKNFSFTMAEESDNFLRKIFLLSLSLFEYLLDIENHFDSSYFETKEEVLKFACFCRKKYLNEMDSIAMMNSYILVQRLSMICNNLFYIYQYLKEKNRRSLTAFEKKWVKKAMEQYRLLYDIFYNKRVNDLYMLDDYRKEFYEEVENLSSVKPKEVPIIYFTGEMIRYIAASATVVWYIIASNPK